MDLMVFLIGFDTVFTSVLAEIWNITTLKCVQKIRLSKPTVNQYNLCYFQRCFLLVISLVSKGLPLPLKIVLQAIINGVQVPLQTH